MILRRVARYSTTLFIVCKLYVIHKPCRAVRFFCLVHIQSMSGAPLVFPEVRISRGKAVIIYNTEFSAANPLHGFIKDAADLNAALTALRFDVELLHNLTAAEMEFALITAATADYRYGRRLSRRGYLQAFVLCVWLRPEPRAPCIPLSI